MSNGSVAFAATSFAAGLLALSATVDARITRILTDETVPIAASVREGIACLEFLQVPVARGPGGEAVTGKVLGRIANRSGKASQPLIVLFHPVPYKPVSLDTAKAKLVSRGGENQRGEVFDEVTIPPSEW